MGRMSALKDRLRADLTTAIKARDELRSSTLRMVLTAKAEQAATFDREFDAFFLPQARPGVPQANLPALPQAPGPNPPPQDREERETPSPRPPEQPQLLDEVRQAIVPLRRRRPVRGRRAAVDRRDVRVSQS